MELEGAVRVLAGVGIGFVGGQWVLVWLWLYGSGFRMGLCRVLWVWRVF